MSSEHNSAVEAHDPSAQQPSLERAPSYATQQGGAELPSYAMSPENSRLLALRERALARQLDRGKAVMDSIALDLEDGNWHFWIAQVSTTYDISFFPDETPDRVLHPAMTSFFLVSKAQHFGEGGFRKAILVNGRKTGTLKYMPYSLIATASTLGPKFLKKYPNGSWTDFEEFMAKYDTRIHI